MKRLTILYFTFLFIFFGTSNLYSQDALYYIHQKSNTELILKQYIKQIIQQKGVSNDALKEVYVNFIPPMGCPRCEGIVTQYNHYLNELSLNKAFIINVLLYKKENALSGYIRRQNFPGNILYVDSTDKFVEIFHINNNKAIVPYLTKISITDGRLIEGIASLGIYLDETLVEQIIQKHSFLAVTDMKDEVMQKEQPVSIKLSVDKFDWDKICNSVFPKRPIDSCFIAKADSLPIVTWFSVNGKDNKLLINNYVENSFFLFTKKSGKWDNPISLSPTDEEGKMYIDSTIDALIYQYCKENNILVSMYLTADFCSKGIYIMASLPSLVLEINDSEDADVGYYNAAVCLVKDYNGKTIKHVRFNEELIDVDNGQYTFSHADATFFAENQLFVFSLQKGWPAVGTSALPNEDNTPFTNDFYDNSNTLLFYNVANETLTTSAPLDLLYKKYKLGYYYAKPMIKKCNQDYYWLDKQIGKVYKLSKDFKHSTLVCDLFTMDTVLHQKPYSETLAYLDSYEPYFYRRVVDFEVYTDNTCKAIIYDGTNYYFYETINKEVKNITLFPQSINTLQLTGLKFGNSEQGAKMIYGLYQNNQAIVTYLFDTK